MTEMKLIKEAQVREWAISDLKIKGENIVGEMPSEWHRKAQLAADLKILAEKEKSLKFEIFDLNYKIADLEAELEGLKLAAEIALGHQDIIKGLFERIEELFLPANTYRPPEYLHMKQEYLNAEK